MTVPYQPVPCARCGLPVLPDQRAAGFWADQWNGRFCGGDPRLPHHAALPGRKKNTALIVVASLVALAVAITAAVALVFTVRGPTDAGQPDRPPVLQPLPTSTRPPEASAGPEAARHPAAPVPCDPGGRSRAHCFPPSTQGPAFLDRVRKAMKWNCYEKGEKDAYDMEADYAQCQASNNVDQPYTRHAKIGYRNDLRDGRSMSEVTMVASTSVVGRGTTEKNTIDVGDDVFEVAVLNLWPRDKALRQETMRAFAGVQAVCAKRGSPEPRRISAGYEVSCSAPTRIAVRNDRGQPVLTITQTMRIDVPVNYGW